MGDDEGGNADGALHAFGIGCIAVDPRGLVAHLSERAQALLGWNNAQACGLPLGEVLRFVDFEAASLLAPPAPASLPAARPRRLVALNRGGEPRPLDVLATPRTGADGATGGFTVALRSMASGDGGDVGSSRLAAIVESSFDAVIAKTLEGVITEWNPGAQRLFGYSAAEAIGQPMHMLIPADRTNEEPALLARIARGEWVEAFDTVRRHKNGTELQVSSTISPVRDRCGRIVGASTIARDVTAHRRAMSALAQAEERFRLVVEASPNGMLLVDAKGRIVMANRRAAEIFGYAADTLAGMSLEQLVPLPLRERHHSHLMAALANPTRAAMAAGRTVFAQRRDGTEFPVEVGLNPLELGGGLHMLASVADITERMRTEDELRRSNTDLEQFAYVASHDLQEPLRMVVSYSELLAKRYQGRLDDKADKYIHYAVDGARRMQRLVADLMAYSRVGSQGRPLLPVDSHVVLRRVLADMRVTIEQVGASIQAMALPWVLADEVQLGQVFQNLIGNAVKFRADAPLRIVITATREAEGWHFQVADNGIGIEPQYAERIFQMFQRLHERGKFEGSGIGLAIVKRIVDRHGGRAWAEGEPGAGSVLHFTLKPAGETARDAAEGPA